MRGWITLSAILLAVLLTGCAASETAETRTAAPAPRKTTAPAATAPTVATTQYASAAAPKSYRVGGEQIRPNAPLVIAVGDSVMLGAFGALRRKIPDLVLADAQGSRQVPAYIAFLRRCRATGHLGNVVVVDVGNNGPLTAAVQFDEMMRVLSGVREVLVVNLTVPPDLSAPNNAVLADGARRYGKVKLVDWHAASSGRPDYFWDGVHLTPEGAQAYADLIASRLGEPERPAPRPGPLEEFFWGQGGTSGECLGLRRWCLSVAGPYSGS